MKFSSCAHLEAPQPATKALICLFLVGLSGNFCVEGRQIGAMESGTNLTSLFSSTMAKSGLNVSPKTHPERILDQEFLSLTNFMNPFLWKSFWTHLFPKPCTYFYVRLIDGVARIFPTSFALTGNWTRVSSVAPLLRTLFQDNLPTELPRPLQFLWKSWRAVSLMNFSLKWWKINLIFNWETATKKIAR